MKRIIALSIIFLFVALVVKASEEATVQASVTAQSISVSVSDGTVAYGTIPLSGSKSTLDLSDMQIATNNGNVTEDINIKGKNSDWTLSAAPGNEQYSHQFCNETDNDCTPETEPPFVDLTTNYQTLDTGILQNGTVDVHLQVWTPTATTYYTVQDIDATIQAVAS